MRAQSHHASPDPANQIPDKQLQGQKLEIEKRNQLERVEQMKKLYFNAGRWAGGARDHVAREAFYKVNEEWKSAHYFLAMAV